jgi:hypothetical protein
MVLMCPAKVARRRGGEGLRERVKQSYAQSRVASAVMAMQQSRQIYNSGLQTIRTVRRKRNLCRPWQLEGGGPSMTPQSSRTHCVALYQLSRCYCNLVSF